MVKQIQALSVFFPAYNEEANIENTVKKAREVLLRITDKWEILVVNDGSVDRTEEIAKRLNRQDSRIRVVTHPKNKGYGATLKTGFSNAKYPWVAFTDADGQFDFPEIKKFIDIQEETGADLVLGYRIKRADPFVRRSGAFLWFLIPRVLWGLKVRDYSCGFKLMRKKVFEDVQPLVGEEKVTQIEMLVKAKRLGFKFAEIGVHHYPRRFGKQTGADIKVVAKSFIDLFKLWKKLH